MADRRDVHYSEMGISSFEMLPTLITGTSQDVVDAAYISREHAKKAKYEDNDRTEDSLRHMLLGGLIQLNPEEEETVGRSIASFLIDFREGDSPEDQIDLNNNIYGRRLREMYPDREEFISKAIEIADAMVKGGEPPELDGVSLQKSYGSFETPERLAEFEEREAAALDIGGLLSRPPKLMKPEEKENLTDATINLMNRMQFDSEEIVERTPNLPSLMQKVDTYFVENAPYFANIDRHSIDDSRIFLDGGSYGGYGIKNLSTGDKQTFFAGATEQPALDDYILHETGHVSEDEMRPSEQEAAVTFLDFYRNAKRLQNPELSEDDRFRYEDRLSTSKQYLKEQGFDIQDPEVAQQVAFLASTYVLKVGLKIDPEITMEEYLEVEKDINSVANTYVQELNQMDKGGLMLAPGGAVQSLGKGLANIFRLKTTREGGPDYVIPPDPTPEAMEIAQKNAAKSIEEGGLGLPPDNTSIDRAKAMGYGIPFYHGTIDEISSIEPFRNKAGFFGANDPPEVAETYAFDPLEQVFGSGITNTDDSRVYTLLMRDDALAKVKDPKNPARVGQIDWGGYNFDNSQEALLDLPNGEQIEFNNISTDDLEDIAREYDLDAIEISQIRDIANRGFPGTKEALQEADYLSTPGTNIPTASGTESAAFSQGLVRAPNAAFDPAKRGSPILTAGLSGTAIALGLVATPEEAEAAYIPLKAFADGSDAAKAFFAKAQKRIDEGADTAPNGELYNEMGVYKSEDGDLKVDVPELRARDVEAMNAIANFQEDLNFYLKSTKQRRKATSNPITRYLPENSPIFENFPDLKNAKVVMKPSKKYASGGEYNPNTQELVIFVDPGANLSDDVDAERIAMKTMNAFNTFIHEFQHHIQDVKKAANTGYSDTASLVGFKGFEKDYFDAVDAINKLKPGEIGYDQFKNRIDMMFGLVRDSYKTQKQRVAFDQASYEDKLAMAKDRIQNFKKTKGEGDERTTNLIESNRFGTNIYFRELGEAEARSAAAKGLLVGDERKAVGIYYPKDTAQSRRVLSPDDIQLDKQIENTHILVRVVPAYNFGKTQSDMRELEVTGAAPKKLSPLEKEQQQKKGDGSSALGPAAVAGTAVGLASPPSEAFVAGLGFDDPTPTASLFDAQGGAIPNELGITNTFLLDLLVPRTKPYDIITNLPGVGEGLMALDLIDLGFGDFLRGEGTEAGQRIRNEAQQKGLMVDGS
jgi:hypothetical protein